MEWNEKVKLVEALNNGEYKEAVDVMLQNEESIDEQAMCMFVNGFALTEWKLLIPMTHIINKYKDVSIGDFRSDVRIGVMIGRLRITE